MMEGCAHEFFDEDDYVYYTLLQVSHSWYLMNCVIWVITFPDGNNLVLTDNLN